MHPSATPAIRSGEIRKPFPLGLDERAREEDDRCDPLLFDGRFKMPSDFGRSRYRLFEEQVPACLCCSDSQLGLDVRWDGEVDRLDVLKHRLVLKVGLHSEFLGKLCSPARVSPPHASEIDNRLPGKRYRMGDPSPVAGPHKPEPHGAFSLDVAAGRTTWFPLRSTKGPPTATASRHPAAGR